jgi:hypothetical protein
MQLNTEQFLAALRGAAGTLTVAADVVTLENGDTFDAAATDAGQPTAAAITPLAAAELLAGLQGDEPAIVAAFRAVPHRERERLAIALSSLYGVLCMESKFQPMLLTEPIKIPVTSFEEGLAVQRALFNLGFGFHHGGYPLSKDLSTQCVLSGIFVSRKGVMTVMPLNEHNSREYVANHESYAVSPETVLAATSRDDLVRRAAA